MPTFSQIQNQFNSAKARNLIGPDESLADFAKKALEFTGDPSYKSVAEGGMIGNFVRGASADLTNFVNSGPVDEWLGAGTEWLGGKFGVDPEAARSVGESLPRMAIDFLPMAAGAALAPFTGGASLPIGMAATSGLSAASGYQESGKFSDAVIGGVAPYLGSKLSEIGGRAALSLVPKSQILQRLGFTGGTQVSGRALSAAEQAGLVTNRGLTESVAKATTKSFTELDKPLDKMLHYLGGEALANVGFTGLDIAQQGTDAVFNRDYLFANLVSNVPFAAADLAGSFGNRPIGEIKYNLPEAPPVHLSDGERRALLAATQLDDLKSPEAVREYRQKYGLDMADIAIRTEELATALNRKELGLREAEDTFTSKWNNYVQNSPEAQQAGIKPVQQGGAFGKERLNIKELMGQEGLPIEAQKIVDEYRMKRTSLKKEVNGVIARLGKPVNTVESLKLGVQQLNLDEFLQTPVEQRDYVKALEGTMLSLDGADLIRDIHRVQAGLEPVRKDLYQEFVDLYSGKPATFTPDKQMELLVAASLARGQTPKFEKMKEKVNTAREEGQTEEVVAEKAIEGLKEENKDILSVFRQPVIPDETLSGLTDLGQRSSADLTRGMVNRPGVKQRFIPDQVESGLTQIGEVADVDLVKNLARKEVKPQVEQTVVKKLIASIPAKWPDEVKNVVVEFYKTGDDTQLKNLGTDKDSELRKKIAYRSLREADPTYEQRLKDWEKAYNEKEAQRQKVLNQIPVHEENIDSDVLEVLNDNRVDQEMIPEEFFRAEDWSRVKDKQGNEYLIPVPEGEFQQVEQFARGLMSKLVSPEMLPESSKELVDLAKLFNNPEVDYAEFGKLQSESQTAQEVAKVYGAASYKAKQIYLNSKALQGLRASDRAAFIFAHEQSHISFGKALEGRYGSQAKIQAEKALAWVNAADPQAKKNVEDVLKELHLDGELAQMDGVRDVLNNPDPQEWLANVMGMYGFGAVKSKSPKQAFAMLPKPVREFAEWLVRHLQNLSKGAMTWLRLSGKDYQGAKHTKELFDSIRRSYRQAEWEAAQAERFLDIEPTSMFDRGEEFAFAQGKMGEVGEQPFKDAPKRWLGGMWNKIIQPMHTLGNLYEGLRAPVMAVFNAHSDTENAIGDVFKVVVGELGADEKVRMTNEAFKKVMGSEQLNKLFNQIQVRSQVVRKRMIKLNEQNTGEVLDFEALSPELRGRLQQFNPEAQKALATMIAQAERANILHQEKILQGEWQGSVHDFATLLASKISFNKQDYGKAVEISKGVLNDLKMANETRSEFDQQRFMAQAQSKLAQLEASDQASASVQAQEIFKRYDDLKKYYDDHPTWMSFRRYGKIKQRIEKNGEFDVIDADTEKELAETLKFYIEQGWKQVATRQVVEKKLQGQYYLNDALLKIMQDREGQFKTMLQEANIPEEEKARLMAVPSATSAMISEINSRELYRPTKGRKLTGDLERFDWWEQFQRYTPAALAAAQRRALGAKINYWMQNPELDSLKLQKDQFMALYEQSKKPDPEWARKLNKLNAVWHIGWNLPGHIAELFQPMLSGVHELVAKGESLPGAIKQFYKTEKDVGKVWGYRLKDKFFKPEDARVKIDGEVFEGLPAMWLRVHGESKENVDIARMLHAKRDRIQKAPLSEIRNFTGEQHAKLQDVISGNRQRTLGEIIASPFTMYANAAMNFYSKFTQHNGIVAMVTAYRKFKKQGMTHEQAMDAAELFDLTVNNSGGRLERPEMFGKLGGAGHLPYGLTSYVRGRFSQLATYYRHGFETEAFANLTPAERGNAKKAFQTMILAQLGAAGILGMPFVGAGIALMEELLGEDLKGKMINALDEVTNDPTLTRVFTHGMMSTMAESFGLPADLHSRFALSSFLGTNSYDGMSAKSFMGPSVAMLDSMFNLGGQIAKGESMEKALTVAGPGGVKRLAEALGEEYQRENPENNLMMSMLGFRSSQQVKKKEWEQITRKQELETRRKLEQSAMTISKALEAGSINGRKQLLIEADKLLPKGLDFQQTTKQRQQNIKDLIQKVSMIEADKVGPQDVRREISGRLAPVSSQTAQSMGVQMSNPMELARALQQQKTRSQLGATVSQRPVRNAMLQEMQWGNNPWEF